MSELLTHLDPLQDEDHANVSVPVLLTDAQRAEVLGRLADFELKLCALPEKRQAFVLAYIADPTNASAAARKAGYATISSRVSASTILRSPDVAACIAVGLLLREDRTMITSERTLNELSIIAFSDIADFTVGEDWTLGVREGAPEYVTRAVASIDFNVTERIDQHDNPVTSRSMKIRLWSKPEAIRMLMMYQKLLGAEATPNVNITNNNGPVTNNYTKNTWKWGTREVKF